MSSSQDRKLTDISAELKHATLKAFLLYDGSLEGWVPKDLVEDNKDGTFTMPEWLAKEKGFI